MTTPLPSPNADCANCAPHPHPARVHASLVGICGVARCPCVEFREMTPTIQTHCSICGRPSHASGRCPYAGGTKP